MMIRMFRSLLLWTYIVHRVHSQEFGSCGGCHCIVEDGEECPSAPVTNYSYLDLSVYQIETPFSLDCDPYNDTTCISNPPVQPSNGACIIETLGDCESGAYRLINYPGSILQAQQEQLIVTHAGSCGLCSTLQDLAAYINLGPRARTVATQCGLLGFNNETAAIECFEQTAGFTKACATIWYYNTKATRERCIDQCAAFFINDIPVNGEPPQCKLADCLQCDEDEAGPIFRDFAGRTRRNSGLLSEIARPCSDLISLTHQDLCAERTIPPTMSPTENSGGMSKGVSATVFTLVALVWVFGLFGIQQCYSHYR